MFDAIKFYVTNWWSKLPRADKQSAIGAFVVAFFVAMIWALL